MDELFESLEPKETLESIKELKASRFNVDILSFMFTRGLERSKEGEHKAVTKLVELGLGDQVFQHSEVEKAILQLLDTLNDLVLGKESIHQLNWFTFLSDSPKAPLYVSQYVASAIALGALSFSSFYKKLASIPSSLRPSFIAIQTMANFVQIKVSLQHNFFFSKFLFTYLKKMLLEQGWIAGQIKRITAIQSFKFIW